MASFPSLSRRGVGQSWQRVNRDTNPGFMQPCSRQFSGAYVDAVAGTNTYTFGRRESGTFIHNLRLAVDSAQACSLVPAPGKALAPTLASQLTTLEGLVTTLQGTVNSQATTIVALTDLNTRLAATWPALPPAVDPPPSCTSSCAAAVSTSDGADLSVSAPRGTVTFSGSKCPETDLCDLAANVRAVMDRLNPAP